MKKIQFLDVKDAVSVQKENGTDVNYYIFEEYEIHLNKIAPKSVQEWHYHVKIEETLLITRGELTSRWIENGREMVKRIGRNELVRVGESIHTFENETDEPVEFVVFRFIPDGIDKREVIRNDKAVIERDG